MSIFRRALTFAIDFCTCCHLLSPLVRLIHFLIGASLNGFNTHVSGRHHVVTEVAAKAADQPRFRIEGRVRSDPDSVSHYHVGVEAQGAIYHQFPLRF